MRIRYTGRLAASVVMSAALAACGGSPPGPSPSGGIRTDTLSGTSSVNAGGGCTGTTHTIDTAGAGDLVIRIAQASLPNVGIQVCHPGAVNHALECTVPPFATVAAGGTVTASLKGARTQRINIHPAGCDTATVAAATLSYTIDVTYPF